MKRRGILTLLLVILAVANVSAERRYVSKTGSSTPPYTSWETATDSIMKAMRISGIGDTIIVGDGIYTEVVRFNAGVVLLGLGWDNTWIQIPQDSTTGVWMENECSISNLKVVGWGMFQSYHSAIRCQRSYSEEKKITISNIMVTFCDTGINVISSGYSTVEGVSVVLCNW